MKTINLYLTFLAIAIVGFGCVQSTDQKNTAAGDPLDQWNEGPVKASILSFIKTVTDQASPDFVAVPDRVAVFDMDGTILLEKPLAVNFDLILRMMAEQIAAEPSLSQKQPYKAIHEEDWAYFDTLGIYGERGIYSILLEATEGYTEEKLRDYTLNYFNTVTDNRFKKPYNQLFFVPMVQLVKYLQDNQFEVYIVSGSDPQFIRTFIEAGAHISPCNIIGTTILTKWVETDSGSHFARVNEIVQPINDEGGKPVNILNKIGKVPIIAIGNSPGDYPMLQFSKNSPFSLQMIVNHDDAEREYVYDTDTMGILCSENGWHKISMKNDFKVVFGE